MYKAKWGELEGILAAQCHPNIKDTYAWFCRMVAWVIEMAAVRCKQDDLQTGSKPEITLYAMTESFSFISYVIRNSKEHGEHEDTKRKWRVNHLLYVSFGCKNQCKFSINVLSIFPNYHLRRMTSLCLHCDLYVKADFSGFWHALWDSSCLFIICNFAIRKKKKNNSQWSVESF